MTIKTIPILMLSFWLFSCGNTTNKKTNSPEEPVTHEGHMHQQDAPAIELDNGEKWKVNDEMMVHVSNMEKDIAAFSGNEIAEYQNLSVKLQAHIDLLTSSCTMKGKAHDELHKWLLPYIDLVKEFSEAQTVDQASAQFQAIQESFSTFHQYFQ